MSGDKEVLRLIVAERASVAPPPGERRVADCVEVRRS